MEKIIIENYEICFTTFKYCSSIVGNCEVKIIYILNMTYCCHVVMCVVVKNVCMEDNHFDEEKKGRYGETGYIYHISRTVNPKKGIIERNCIAILKKLYFERGVL